ncbi:c-type cytochrome [Pedobacter sp. JCM 36344]|uniref:c-type cytochrome n=1 Tax=Pedobacter sp. JCM 36344 TaxID=3374280 RepID=UPI00397AFD26
MRNYLLLAIIFTTLASIVISCQDARQVQQDMYYTNGRDLYIAYCQNCHGANGEGLAKLAPPLTDTLFLKSNKKKLACWIKNGVSEQMIVAGEKYEGKMPDHNFANIDIAQMIVYVTNTFGNKQGNYTQNEVAADLSNCN